MCVALLSQDEHINRCTMKAEKRKGRRRERKKKTGRRQGGKEPQLQNRQVPGERWKAVPRGRHWVQQCSCWAAGAQAVGTALVLVCLPLGAGRMELQAPGFYLAGAGIWQ